MSWERFVLYIVLTVFLLVLVAFCLCELALPKLRQRIKRLYTHHDHRQWPPGGTIPRRDRGRRKVKNDDLVEDDEEGDLELTGMVSEEANSFDIDEEGDEI